MNKLILTIQLYPIRDAHCALVGKDLETGVTGFGGSPEHALRNLLEELLLTDLEVLIIKHAKQENSDHITP